MGHRDGAGGQTGWDDPTTARLRGPQLEEDRVTITSPKRLSALALAALFVVGACSSSGGSATPTAQPSAAAPSAAAPSTDAGASTAPSAATGGGAGSINVSGSSTVEPISTAVAEGWSRRPTPASTTRSTGPGTGDGFKTFCKGETDISDASRKIKDEEAATCKAAGIEYTELKIAYDGMTVMTSPGQRRGRPACRSPTCTR